MAQEKLAKKLQALQDRLAAETTHKSKLMARYKGTIDTMTIAIMNEANAAGLNAAQVILSLHATNTKS